MDEIKTYRVLMDERWRLEDLHAFPHAFSQAYSFIYCLDTELPPKKEERIDLALQGYPWNGGYSYVNIYSVFQYQVPPDERPLIRSIQYASPGWMDIALNPGVALQIAKSVGGICGALYAMAEAFKRIDKLRLEIARQRRAAKVEMIKMSVEEAVQLNRLSQEVAEHLGFSSLEKLNKRTKDPEVSLKLLMAHWRRLNVLANYVREGKVALPEKLKNND